jgi:hypothetical protein
MDEGTSWSAGTTIYTLPTPDLQWYSYYFDATGESIRFKFTSAHNVSIGELKLIMSSRVRETNE